MKAEGRTALSIPGDIRDEAFCKRLVAEALEVSAASTSSSATRGGNRARASILDISTEDFDATMKTNIYAPVLDHQGGAASHAARLGHHRHRLRAGLRPLARPLRLCPDEGCDDELCEVAGEAARFEGHSGERGRSGADLDAVASERRRHAGQVGEVRRPDASWVGPANPRSSGPFTSSSRCPMRALRQARSMAPREEAGSLEALRRARQAR